MLRSQSEKIFGRHGSVMNSTYGYSLVGTKR